MNFSIYIKKKLLCCTCILLCTCCVWAQSDLTYSVEIQGLASSGEYAPFWLQSNRFGTVSAQPYSGNLIVGIARQMPTAPTEYTFRKGQKLFDYGFGLKAIGQVDDKCHFLPQEYFATARLWIFDATVGSMERHYGNQDTDLSSGGFLFSGNARPIPGITVGISEYRNFPYTKGYLQIKGGITYGWYLDNVYIQNERYHHKFAGARVGGSCPVNLSYEFHHVAQWGGVSPVYGELGSSFGDFINAFLVRSGGTMANDQINAQGNHIGSQQLALDVNLKTWNIHTYWQQVFEDGPINLMWNSMSVPDGLYGIAVSQTQWPYIGKILFEYLNTTDQSGPVHDIDGIIFGGNDSYFINSIYRNGWNYYYRTMGTPFITSPIYNFDGTFYTKNNRTQVFHLGIMGNICGYRYKTLFSHSKNYGTYQLPIDMLTNTAVMLLVEKHFSKMWNMDVSVAVSADAGSQFGNSTGVMLSVKKTGIITRF